MKGFDAKCPACGAGASCADEVSQEINPDGLETHWTCTNGHKAFRTWRQEFSDKYAWYDGVDYVELEAKEAAAP